MRCSCRNSPADRAALLGVAVLAAAVLATRGVTAAEPLIEGSPAAAQLRGENWLLVLPTVNGAEHPVALLARDQEGGYYADAQTLADWRIAPPYPPPVEIDGKAFHRLDDFAGCSVAVAERSMTVEVTVPPQFMLGTRRSLAQRRSAVTPDGAFGAYLDYDLTYSDDDTPAAEAGLSSLLYPTLFTKQGSLLASVLYQDASARAAAAHSWVRLDTTWNRDNPDARRTLRVGDAVTPYGSWARSVRFGGVQLGTNFATRPEEVTFPQPSIEGTAAVPSALDIFVNGNLRSRTDVPSGAFHIDDVPIVTGAGQIQVVTRDLLGREQMVTQDFYVSDRLLKRDLNEYSVSAGALRENFGIASNDYGDFLVAGMLRRGLSDLLTIEGRIAGTAAVQTAGASIARAMGSYGVTSAALAISDDDATGVLWQLGHEYQGRTYRASLRVQRTRDFAQPGLEVFSAWPKLQIVASGGRSFGKKGSFGLSYVDERFAQSADDRQLVSLSYSRSLTRHLMLGASGRYIDDDDGGFAATITVLRTLGPRSSASTSLYARSGGSTLRVDHRYELPAGPGFGYRTSLADGNQRSGSAEVAMNTEHARYSAELSQYEEARGWRLTTRGSVAMLDGALFAAREINDGFAVVDAGGFEGVRVYLENREIGATNRHGRLLVPSLRPYERNQLRIESADLPLTVRIDNPAIQVAPYYRSGALASFGIGSGASVLVRAVTEDGRPVPEGARARLGDGAADFPVGLDGRLYLQDAVSAMRVEIVHGGTSLCSFTLPELDRLAEGVPDLGEVLCRRDGDRAAQ